MLRRQFLKAVGATPIGTFFLGNKEKPDEKEKFKIGDIIRGTRWMAEEPDKVSEGILVDISICKNEVIDQRMKFEWKMHDIEYWKDGIWHRDMYYPEDMTKLGHINVPPNLTAKEFDKWLEKLYDKHGYGLRGIVKC